MFMPADSPAHCLAVRKFLVVSQTVGGSDLFRQSGCRPAIARRECVPCRFMRCRTFRVLTLRS